MCDDAGIAAYLGALDSCFRARFDLADALLRRLGCRWRLSDPLWRCVGSPVVPGPGAGSQIGCGGGAGVAISDAPLAAHLLAQLQAGFAEAAPFWHVHHYADPDTPFFSFVYQLVRRARGAPAAGKTPLGGGDMRAAPRRRAWVLPRRQTTVL